MSVFPVSIGLSIYEEKCYYLSWIPSESGPLITSYGKIEIKNNKIPFKDLFDKVKQYNSTPRFTISLSNNYVKYDFSRSYINPMINNWDKEHFYDKEFSALYDSYLYKNEQGIFNIHISKDKKNDIIAQVKERKYTLMNLGVGIFSALEGVKSWYNINNIDKYMIMKFSKKREIELLLIDKNNFSSYAVLKKNLSSFKVINYLGSEKYRIGLLNIADSIFKQNHGDINLQVFYYSIGGNKEDIDLVLNSKTDKLELINPFKNLTFDDSCKLNINNINASSYSELGNAFRGIDA